MDAKVYRLECGVQPYAWGEKAKNGRKPFIADLLNLPAAEGKPFAELWIGAHPSLPAKLENGASLVDFIRTEPAAVLGKKAAAAGATGLAFLLKVLSCDQALSIQAHPAPDLAKLLHAKDPQHYPDPNPKPEIAIAVTPFEALAQFRPVPDIRRDVERHPALRAFFAAAGVKPDLPDAEWLRAAYAALFRAPQADVTRTVRDHAAAVRASLTRSPHDGWYLELLEVYPDDRGALSLYFLNLVHLEPGECIYLGAGEPHAYLRGTIIECMANSDNVVRAGLTPKFVDTDVLLNMLTYSQTGVHRLAPKAVASGVKAFVPPTPEFQVEQFRGAKGGKVAAESGDQVSLLLVLGGAANLRTPQGAVAAPRGSIWLWPACLGKLEIEFTAPGTTVVRARPNQG